MITKIYSIFDDKAKVYNKPFHQLNEAVALRACKDLLEDPTTEINRHPEDYVLFELGTYDDNIGGYELIKGKKIMFRFSELQIEPTYEIDPDMPTLGEKTV